MSATTTEPAAKPAAVSRHDARRRERRGLLRAMLLLSLLLPALFLAAAGWMSRNLALAAAEEQAQVSLGLLYQDSAKLFAIGNFVAGLLQARLGNGGWAAIEGSPEFHREIAGLAKNLPQVAGLWMVDAAGWLHASSRDFPALPVNIAKDECVAALRAGGAALCATSEPNSPMTETPAFDIVRRIADEKGGFAGAVGLSLAPDYFQRFYKDAAQDGRTALGLLRADGKVLAWSQPYKAQHPLGADADLMRAILREPGAGHFTGSTGLDDGERLVSYRQLEPYPVYAVVAVSRAAVLAAWRAAMIRYAVLTGAAVVLLLSFTLATGWLLRGERAESESARTDLRRLETENEGLRRLARMREFRAVTENVAEAD